MIGQEDKLENYVIVDYWIEEDGDGFRIMIIQGNICDEKSVVGSEKNWNGVFEVFRKVVEK